MNYSIQQIFAAVNGLTVIGGDKEPILKELNSAMEALKRAAEFMDTLQVSGRDTIDTLLGCMLAVDAVIGKEENNG